MNMKTNTEGSAREFRLLYTMGFVFAMSLALPLYINSSFLGQYAPERLVGVLYTAGSVITLFALAVIPRVLSRFGNYRTIATIATMEAVLLLGLAFFTSFPVIAAIFVLYSAFLSLIFFNFDVFLETYSSESRTGRIRGTFLTSLNLAILVSPLIAGLILTNGDYWKVYVLAAVLTTVLVLLLFSNFKHFKDPAYDHVPFWGTFRQMWRDGDMYHIFVANLLLRFFFAWMVIYMPLYLHDHIGFAWSEIGTIFTIMLLPFVLFELPAGRLADTRFGEKEIMSMGFLIMGVATIMIVFLDKPVFWLWALVLFITRIGASLVEIMTESYFFKHVDGTDTNVIGFFRNNRPIAYTAAPLIASALLFVIDFKYLFAVLGVIMFLGLRYALALKDTR